MTLEQLEAEVLALPKDTQVILLARLLGLVGQNSEIDPEITESWAEEAERRNEAMNTAQSIGIPARDVFKRVRASFQ